MKNYVVAKSPDGSVQINFTLPFTEIAKAREKATAELAKDVELPGFRKGKAPLEKAREKISKEKITEKALLSIIPPLLTRAIEEEKIRPATYPKIELLKAEEGEPWEVRVMTCELPKIVLPDYKGLVNGIVKVETRSRDEKVQEIVKVLIEAIPVTIPKVLIDEEVNARLSSLLSRIEKLGLTLENYLSSLGKNPEALRKEYEDEAKRAIALELILNEIAAAENIDVTPEKVEEAIAATEAAHGHEHAHDDQQKQTVRSILRRSAVLDSLAALM